MRQVAPASKIATDPYVEGTVKAAVSLHKRSVDLHTDLHVHSKGQLLYAEEGVTRLYTQSGSFLLPTRHCAWIPAGTVHQVTSSSPQLFLRTLYFQVSNSYSEPFYSELSVFQVNDLLREMIVYSARWADTVTADKEEETFMEALLLILPNLQGTSLGLRLPASRHPMVLRILNILLRDLSERISIEQVAASACVSTRTISRLFQKELGMSFAGFLKVARIIKALELLCLPGASVSETAYRVGYESVPSFSNSFQEIVGARPQSFLH